MKARWLFIFILVFLISACQKEKKIDLKNEKDKMSYSIGWRIGTNIQKDSIDIDIDAVATGLKDGLSGKGLLSDKEVNELMNQMRMKIMKQRAEKRKTDSEKNQKEGEAFLAKNKKEEGVVALPSGLQYKILKEGKGKKPKKTDRVKVNYRGTLIDGTEFDSSFKRGQSATFSVQGVIPGWTEALQLMPVGSKWKLFVPSKIAYRERGAGPKIGPNATLIFEIELLSIDNNPPAKKGPSHPPKRRPGNRHP